MESKTIWLAKDVDGDYRISTKAMFHDGFYFWPCDEKQIDISVIENEHAERMILPELKEGEQNQYRRTPQGWEVVK